MSTIPVETYARIGFIAGTGATVIPAALHGSSLIAALVIGAVIGTLTGAGYGALRAVLAR